MSRIIVKSLAASLLSLGLAFGAAAGGPETDSPLDEPSCDIRVDGEDGIVVLEALVFAPTPVSGVYEMDIAQGGRAGRSNIRQGGEFEAVADAPSSLGIVSLSTTGGYIATLTVHWDDGSADCTLTVDSATAL